MAGRKKATVWRRRKTARDWTKESPSRWTCQAGQFRGSVTLSGTVWVPCVEGFGHDLSDVGYTFRAKAMLWVEEQLAGR